MSTDSAPDFQETSSFTFEWTLRGLKNLLDLTKGEHKSKVTKSPLFGGGQWQILFYANSGLPKDGSAEGNYVSLYLACEPTTEEKDAADPGRWVREGVYKFCFELRNLDKTIFYSIKEARNRSFSWKTPNWGWAQFIRRVLISVQHNFKSQDALLIICTITSPSYVPPPLRSVPKSLIDTMGKERQHQSHAFQPATEPNSSERWEEVPLPGSSSPPLSESSYDILQSLLVILTQLRVVQGPLVNDNSLLLFRELLNFSDATIASGMEATDSDVELFLDFLLHLLCERTVQVKNFAQDAKRKARRLMFKLVSKTNVLPRHLFITDLEIDPQAIAIGGFGRVFKGRYGGQLVALKMLYQSRRAGDSIEQNLYTEALAWRSLSHQFILPLLGIYQQGPQLFLVSPFMTNGPLRDWRKDHIPVRIDEIRRLLLEVAEGVRYIHSEGIVHGDLHGANVLLDSELHCQITDFGSTRHCDVTVTRSTTTLSFNFAAPELFGMCATCGELDCDKPHGGEDEQHKIKTMKTDVYAFGCLYYAIYFDTVPFHRKSDIQIMRFITKGVRPERLDNPVMEEHIWNLVQRCWKSIPSDRPTMEEIVATLT